MSELAQKRSILEPFKESKKYYSSFTGWLKPMGAETKNLVLSTHLASVLTLDTFLHVFTIHVQRYE